MAALTQGTGYRSTETQVLGQPRIPVPNRRGVLVSHGAGTPPSVYTPDFAQVFTAAGYPVFAGNLGASLVQMGNDDSITATGAAWTYMKTAAGGSVKSDKVLLFGASMGCLNLLSWAIQNPTLVQAIVLGIPVIDLQDVYVNNKGGNRAAIATAYGVVARADGCTTTIGSATVADTFTVAGDLHAAVIGPDIPTGAYAGQVTAGVGFNLSSSETSHVAIGATATSTTNGCTVMQQIPNRATHSPFEYSNANKALLTMPIKIWASDDDPAGATTAVCQTWATSVNAQGGNVTVVSLGSVGHTLPNPITDFLAFFDANGGRS